MAFDECIFNLLSLFSKIVKIFVIEEVSGLTHAQIPVLHQAEPKPRISMHKRLVLYTSDMQVGKFSLEVV